MTPATFLRAVPPERGDSKMHAEYLKQDEDLVIIGPAIRTSSEKAGQDIPLFWQRFMREHLPALKDARDVYAVYCDYESDYRGPYTLVIGTRVSAEAPVPEGLRRVVIPRGEYARFIARGDPAQALVRSWAHVWNDWERRGARRYVADFERHDLAAMTRGTVEAEVHVGLT
ncbi:effector binding domain-containing protein [Pyxidicoccus parkwayensis]|uniref:Effector binding domain-containing protein n=1 Tax=Pyxidicoccus parkwayensis TaxID=2813578 RepID=A0ABX7NSJ9_9BACT|nr:effector binding domain-containing protein [Pyxidicoccus parkwaysis]QSQ21869.1 effector binding domain-containing protein [Pyxidicoccus parkwaysis]